MLVPIRVGMILLGVRFEDVTLTCPHTRGDDPRNPQQMVQELLLVPIRVGMIHAGG